MPFGGQNEQTARIFHSLLIRRVTLFNPVADFIGVGVGIGCNRLENFELDIAAQLNIGPATGHVGCNRHRAQLAGIGDNLRLLFVLAGVQNIVLHTGLRQHLRQEFRLLDRGRPHQNRLSLFVGGFDLVHHGLIFFLAGAIDLIVLVNTGDRFVGWHFHHAQIVDLGKFLGFGGGGAGHAAQLVIQAEVILEGHRGQRHVFRLNLAAFLRFDRLMKPVRQTAPGHHAAGKFVNQHHFVVANDIILVAGEQLMGFQRVVHMMNDGGAFRIVKRLALGQQTTRGQKRLERVIAFIGEGHTAGFFVKFKGRIVQFGDQLVNGHVKLGPVL